MLFRSKSRDGTRISGFIVTPPGWKKGKPLPAILKIHGGPVSQFANTWMPEWQVLASAGYTGDLRILTPVGTTRLEAERTRDMANREGWKRIIVVTSPIHTRRACATFETVGLAVTCRPSPDRTLALDRLVEPGPGDEHDVAADGRRLERVERLAQLALQAIAHDGVADLARDGHADTRVIALGREGVDDEVPARRGGATAVDRVELGRAGEAAAPLRAVRHGRPQADRRLRPRARRRRMTA